MKSAERSLLPACLSSATAQAQKACCTPAAESGRNITPVMGLPAATAQAAVR